ncbi:FAD-binding oxidoreductase [Nocardia stercoris]|nr:FAD-binding oxidoreductase [Nocardia stercoris]
MKGGKEGPARAGNEFSRGTFLRSLIGATVAGAGFAALSRSGEPAVAQAQSMSGLPGSTSIKTDWNDLRSRIAGRVLLGGDPGFPAAKQIFNTRFDDRTPLAVVQVATVEDVRTAICFAAQHGIVVAARSGGHSYAGVSSADDVMIIDVRGLRGVSYGGGQAVVAPGHTLYEVYQELDRYGQSIPTGMCPDVGIAGLTLGGGLGFESRRYGVTCDRLTAATMVLPDGTVTDVSATSRPDLFWAIRGGGPLFGIVTSFTFDTIPATPKDLVRLTFPGDRAGEVIAGWTQWLQTADRAQWADISIDADGNGALDCWMQLVCPALTGGPAAAALASAIGMVPLSVEIDTLGHIDAVRYLAGGCSTQPRASFTNGSDVVEELTPDAIGRIIQSLTTFSEGGGTGWVQINTLDGAIRDTAAEDTAFPWRNHAALVEWGAYQPIPPEVAQAWVTSSHELFESVSAGAYANYLEPGDALARYYGDNYDRLTEIRRCVDPGNRIFSVLDG